MSPLKELHYCTTVAILHICRHCESSLFRGRGCLADGLGLGKDIAINRSSMTRCELEPMAEPGAAPNEVEGAEEAPHNLLPRTSIQANRPKPHGCPRQCWLAMTSSPPHAFGAGCREVGGTQGLLPCYCTWKNLFLKAHLLLNNNPWHFCDTLIIAGYLLVRVERLWHLEQECAGPVLPIKEQ